MINPNPPQDGTLYFHGHAIPVTNINVPKPPEIQDILQRQFGMVSQYEMNALIHDSDFWDEIEKLAAPDISVNEYRFPKGMKLPKKKRLRKKVMKRYKIKGKTYHNVQILSAKETFL